MLRTLLCLTDAAVCAQRQIPNSTVHKDRTGCQNFPRVCRRGAAPCTVRVANGQGWEDLKCTHAFEVPINKDRAKLLGLRGSRLPAKAGGKKMSGNPKRTMELKKEARESCKR